MKFVCTEYGLDLTFKENQANVIAVENPVLYAEIVQELYCQCDGSEGMFVISDNNKILPFAKHVNLVTDIFSLNCNERKLIAKLYQEIEKLAEENLVQENKEVNSSVAYYLEKICEQVPYHLEYQAEIMPSIFMKMVDLKFDTETDTLLERIVEYLGILNTLSGSVVNIFVNLKMFLTKEEIKSLYEYAFGHKITLVLLEGISGERLPGEELTIIDMDKCTITV